MVHASDIVLHYARGAVIAVSHATDRAVEAARPPSLPGDLWNPEGWLLYVQISDLALPIGRDEIPEIMRTKQAQPMFYQNGAVAQGYLFPVDVDWFAQFVRKSADRLPANIVAEAQVPAEVTGGADKLLRSLIGQHLQPLTGGSNMIIAVTESEAIVTTDSSTKRQPVPIKEVQIALDLLQRDGSVTCLPDQLGHHSSFIGAVLCTLPGTVVELHPPTVSFATHADSTSAHKRSKTATTPPGAASVLSR